MLLHLETCTDAEICRGFSDKNQVGTCVYVTIDIRCVSPRKQGESSGYSLVLQMYFRNNRNETISVTNTDNYKEMVPPLIKLNPHDFNTSTDS